MRMWLAVAGLWSMCGVMACGGVQERAPQAGEAGATSPSPEAQASMAQYAGQLYGCLQETFTAPTDAGPGLSAHLYIKVSESGQVVNERIATSSGHAAFDEALLAAVEQCRATPPPAPEVQGLLQSEGLTLLFQR